MPIKDLQTNKPGLARAGVIRLGYKVKKCAGCKKQNLSDVTRCHSCNGTEFGKPFPVPSDHFVLTDAPGVAEALGTAEPQELRVWLPFDTIEQVFPAYHQYWVASALVCRGDGESIHYAIRPDSGRVIVRDGVALEDFESTDGDNKRQNYVLGQYMPCPGTKHDKYAKCKMCKPNAMLIVLLRDVPRLAYYQVATTSIHNIVNLTQELEFIKQKTNGRLSGVPFVLRLAPREISVPRVDNKGNQVGRMRTTKHLLSLEVDEEWYQELMSTERRLADPGRLLQLEAPKPQPVKPATPAVIEMPRPQPAPVVMFADPPAWMPPNGGDDSGDDNGGDLMEDNWAFFVNRALALIPWYADEGAVSAMLQLAGLEYRADQEDALLEALAGYARAEADKEIATSEQGRLL